MSSSSRRLGIWVVVGFLSLVGAGVGQTAAPAPAQSTVRTAPPARDPHTPGYVEAKELPDGENVPANVDGNFIVGPTHKTSSAMAGGGDVAKGDVIELTAIGESRPFTIN
jgi:enterochelin esterase family protein